MCFSLLCGIPQSLTLCRDDWLRNFNLPLLRSSLWGTVSLFLWADTLVCPYGLAPCNFVEALWHSFGELKLPSSQTLLTRNVPLRQWDNILFLHGRADPAPIRLMLIVLLILQRYNFIIYITMIFFEKTFCYNWLAILILKNVSIKIIFYKKQFI